ncbi:MAG TPA: hypothetical protein VM554_10220 [Acidisarcina sp.]|nr:hypothetical protein [Acidisarcina sp.]
MSIVDCISAMCSGNVLFLAGVANRNCPDHEQAEAIRALLIPPGCCTNTPIGIDPAPGFVAIHIRRSVG